MLNPVICSGCGQRVFETRDHNGVPALVEIKDYGPAPYDGGLVATRKGYVTPVKANMTRSDEPIYRWHTASFTFQHRVVTNIICGQFVTDKHRGLGWPSMCPLRFPELKQGGLH